MLGLVYKKKRMPLKKAIITSRITCISSYDFDLLRCSPKCCGCCWGSAGLAGPGCVEPDNDEDVIIDDDDGDDRERDVDDKLEEMRQ